MIISRPTSVYTRATPEYKHIYSESDKSIPFMYIGHSKLLTAFHLQWILHFQSYSWIRLYNLWHASNGTKKPCLITLGPGYKHRAVLVSTCDFTLFFVGLWTYFKEQSRRSWRLNIYGYIEDINITNLDKCCIFGLGNHCLIDTPLGAIISECSAYCRKKQWMPNNVV